MKNVINKRHTTKCFVVVNAYEAATNFSIDRESTNNVSIYVHYHKRSKLGKVLKSEWYSYSLYPFKHCIFQLMDITRKYFGLTKYCGDTC